MSFKQNLKSLVWVDYISALIMDPRLFAVKISESKRRIFPSSFLVSFLALFSVILSFSMLLSQSEFFYYKITYGLVLGYVILMTGIFLFALSADFVFQYLGYPGKSGRIFSVMNYSLFPFIFVLPGVVIFNSIEFAPLALLSLAVFGIAALVYSVYFLISVLSEMNSAPVLTALAAVFLPLIALSIAGILCGISFIGIFYGFLMNI
ncbi:MAG: hypothetical protein KA015_01905 [Spirochaetes bacterium]|nr:hypothetical protein [Spirochaetota bacterium]